MSSGVAEQQSALDKKRSRVLLYFSHVFTIIEMEARKLRKDPSELIMRGIQPALWLLVLGRRSAVFACCQVAASATRRF